jgi:branched-subunit amino acid aminotransferase/4-amino-4-deoxychorismate lyase
MKIQFNLPVFFESILYYKDGFPFLSFHLERILELANHFQIKFPLSIVELESILRQSLNGSEEQKLRLKLHIRGQSIQIAVIESYSIYPNTFNQYPPVSLVVYPHYTKPINDHSQWKYENRHIYQDSMKYAEENGASQSILLDNRGNIAETSLSNFFYIMEDKIHTPPLSSGAVNGVFRRYLISTMTIIEQNLDLGMLPLIQACFITSAVRGIVPVNEIDTQRYQSQWGENFRESIWSKNSTK